MSNCHCPGCGRPTNRDLYEGLCMVCWHKLETYRLREGLPPSDPYRRLSAPRGSPPDPCRSCPLWCHPDQCAKCPHDPRFRALLRGDGL
jgi:hypothetical protein